MKDNCGEVLENDIASRCSSSAKIKETKKKGK